jgi:2,4-diketo-3-deoxy-L-fuconate hydrolase
MFRLANLGGRTALIQDGLAIDLAELADEPALSDPMVAVARHRDLHDWGERARSLGVGSAFDAAALGPVVTRPSQVFAIGLNYRSHAEESNLAVPTEPVTFTKFPSCLAGPSGDLSLVGDQVDWEVELVVVIGNGGRDIAERDAWAHVAGLTVGQDISDRRLQLVSSPPQFSLGKSRAGYGPIGPALVSIDAVDDPDDVALWCDVAGERMQEDRSSDMIFSVSEVISYLSSICELRSGDVIFTGTPGGVGMGRGRYLCPGDELVTGAEGIGTMHHRCVP